MAEDFWKFEQSLWVEGTPAYEKLLHPNCIMVFPAPAGIIGAEAILNGIDGAPRWLSVKLDEQSSLEANGDTVILAYRAEGRRQGSPAYRAFCSSTYVRHAGEWRIIQHQQTPIA